MRDAMPDAMLDTMPNPMLEARRISRFRAGRPVLNAVDLQIEPGDVLALMGGNGAGKSTLMKILAGVDQDYQGEIRVDGNPARFGSVLDAERAGIAMIHQELNLVPNLTVAANIVLGREPHRFGVLDRAAAASTARRVLDQFALGIDPDARVGDLRVGEQQLVEIAKALSIDARVLIMDEPTSALSPSEADILMNVVRRLSADGVAIIYISHRMDEVMELAKRLMILRDGEHVLTAPIETLSRDQIVSAMVGRTIADATRRTETAQHESAPIALSVRDLWLDAKTPSGTHRVVDGVSFDVRKGEIFGIGGLLGSGRTEVLETIFGARHGAHGGTIAIDGAQVDITTPRAATRHGLALVTEDRKERGLLLDASIRDNVALPSLADVAKFGVRQFQREAAIAAEYVDALSLRCTSVEQPARALSGGNQQKVVIAKWLAMAPKILLLDEPTRGIDVGAKDEIYRLMFTLAQQGMAIVVVSSELPELIALSDRILVMCEGRPTGILDHGDATEERIMDLASRGSRHGVHATEANASSHAMTHASAAQERHAPHDMQHDMQRTTPELVS